MRRKSFKILYDVFYKKTLLNDAINTYFTDDMQDIDKAFIKKETTGVIENLSDIDSIINKYSKVKTKKLNSDILIVFRLAIYEMFYMDRVPVYAIVNEYVNIIKKSKSAKLSSYVNAVLRSIEREELSKKGDIKILDAKYCYFRTYNDKESIVLEELNDKNIKYKKYDGSLKFHKAKVYTVDRYKEIIDTNSFKKGHIIIEDASSIYLTDMLSFLFKDYKEDNLSILDICASPGGKILGFIDLISDKKPIDAIACDISNEKILKIEENIKRLIHNHDKKEMIDIKTKINDGTLLNAEFIDKFDLLICDVPCTGLGVVDKKPDIKLNYSEKKRDELSAIQKKILDVSKHYVKSGGFLSYSTCTENREENEDNIDDFLSKNSDFKLVYEKKIKRKDENKCDGFYIAILKYDDKRFNN